MIIFAGTGGKEASMESGSFEEVPVLGLLVLKGLDESPECFVGLAAPELADA
jgi:hypothetical protein